MDNKTNTIYSMNYNEKSKPLDLKSRERVRGPETETVTANLPTLRVNLKREYKSRKTSNIYDKTKVCGKEKTKYLINDDDVCIRVKSNKKILLYKILYCSFVLIFSSLGLYIFSSMVYDHQNSIDVSSPYKNEYYQLLAPVVMNDPAPFNAPENADIQTVVSSSIWKLITENGTQKYNRFDERGFSLIPVCDIVKATKELFGENYNLNLSESIFGSFFTFYVGEENFHISAVSNQNTCVPFIKELTEVDDTVILNVGYVSRDDKFLKSGDEKSDEPNPVKFMQYTLKKDNSNASYYIYSIQNV